MDPASTPPARASTAKGNPLLEIGVTILVPAIVLMQLSSAERLGPAGALVLALAFPLFWGVREALTRRKVSGIAILGVVSQSLLPKIGGGRVAAYEVLVVTSAIGNLIRENKTFRINSAIQTGAKLGMRLLDDDLFRLWNEKKVSEEDVMAKAQQPDDLQMRIDQAKRGVYEDEDQPRRGRD